MNKKIKKIISVLLAIVLLSCIPLSAYAIDSDSASIENGDFEFAADSAFGAMLAQTIDDETDLNSNYSVTAIEINGSEATVTYLAESDCTLLVGIYDETTGEMLTYGKEKVYEFEKTATVSFEKDPLPEYFIVKAYLVSDNGAALCKNYVSYVYTKAFEENFINTTVSDFDENKVINLDDSYDTNFAVIANKTKKVNAESNSNILQSDYSNDEVYTFVNIDSQISSLNEGDIFWYDTGIDTDVIIIKIKDIKINGTTATITADKTSIDEVFDYVKIEESDDEYKMSFKPNYDENNEDVDSPKAYNTYSMQRANVDEEVTVSTSINYPFGEDGEGWKINENIKVTGSISFTVGATIKIYYKGHWFKEDYLQVEASISPTFKVNASVNAEMKEKEIKQIGEVSIAPCPGLFIKFTPQIVLQASTKITISGELTVKAGFEYNNNEGFVNKCERPSFKPKIEIEGKFFFGISLSPHVSVIHEKVADAGITAEAGFEISAKNKPKSNTHSCLVCIDGDINFKIEVSAYIQFLNKFKPKATIFNTTDKLADFYFSVTYSKFGWGECPYDTESEPIEFNGHYYITFNKGMTWTGAKEYCENLGGHLATITSQEEQKFIYESLVSINDRNNYWLGGYKKDSTWYWVTDEPFKYNNWNGIEPNNYNGLEDKLHMYNNINPETGNGKGAWNDLNDSGTCNNEPFFGLNNFGFICEWESYRDYKKGTSAPSNPSEETCITELPVLSFNRYTGNLGDSAFTTLDDKKTMNPSANLETNAFSNTGVDGKQYGNGYCVWIARWNYGDRISWAEATFDLSGKYQKLKGKSTLLKSYNTTDFNTSVYFYNGDDLLHSFTMTPDNYNFDFSVDVTGVKELRILVKDNEEKAGGTCFALYDMFVSGAGTLSGAMAIKNYAPVKAVALNDNLSQSVTASYFDNAVTFAANPKSIYMIYSVSGNNDVRYISQGTANENGTVKADFFKTADTRTYVVGYRGSEIACFELTVSDHVHSYNKEITPAKCTEDGFIVFTCSCGDTYTETISATGHTDANKDGICDNCSIKLESDNPSANCSHFCHSKSKFVQFFYKIFRFFWRLFKINKYCSCGAAHY